MKLSLNWLKQYVDIPKDLSPEELALKLTMSTVEVEEVIYLSKQFENMVVGEIMDIVDHPDADKLKVCKVKAGSPRIRSVEAGKDEHQVICGASNIYKGMKGILALPGAMVKWHGAGDLVKLEKAKIRGVESNGMLCAHSEVGLPSDFNETDGVVDLKEGKPGQSVAEVLGLDDVIFDIDNKSITHRSDLWGHYGIAREISAILGTKLKDLEISKFKEGNEVDLKINIEDKENCSRYIGVVMGNIKIEPSPLWMQNLLIACDVRPINNIVDITNFVTLELGRPSHAFDRRDIADDTIIVRRAKSGEKLTTLDGQARKMTSDMCLVCDAKRPVDLGGIMGGENSEVKEDTTEIILELANFNPVNIRKTALKLDLRTEAATRFEKGLAPELAQVGLERIISLVKELIPEAELISKVVDVSYEEDQSRIISLDMDFLNKRIGQELSKKEVIKILENLSFSIHDNGDILEVKIPSFRTVKDISIPEDLVEEVARIYGFDNIMPTCPLVAMEIPETNLEVNLIRKIKDILSKSCGLTEVSNYSFIGQKNIELLKLDTDSHIELKNYLSEEQKYLRVSLFENILNNFIDNSRFYNDLNIFEVGRVFLPEAGGYAVDSKQKEFLCHQPKKVAGLTLLENGQSFYKAKGALETLLKKLEVNYSYTQKSKCSHMWLDKGSYQEIVSGNEQLGWLAVINSSTLHNLGSTQQVAVWELDINSLLKFTQDNIKYQSLPKFPGITYDFSMVVEQQVLWADIQKEVKEISSLIKKVELFDVYQIEKFGPHKKSLAFHVHFLAPDKTLTIKEADELRDKIINILNKKFKAEIR